MRTLIHATSLVLTFLVLATSALAQDIAQRSITFGQFKITIGLKKDDLFRRMESQYWFEGKSPASDVANVAKGYGLYLLYAKTPENTRGSTIKYADVSKDYPVGELAFQDGVLVLAMKFWLTKERDKEGFVNILSQEMESLTDNGNRNCMVYPPLPALSYTSAKIRVVCGNKSLEVYDGQIEERLIAP